jgi:5-dehydro-2-deoxygluconokinase
MKNELIILPFDHRSSFIKDILNVEKLNDTQKVKVEELKSVIFEGFKSFISTQNDKSSFGILVDEMYGKKIIKEAKDSKTILIVPVEKSGQPELDFEYGKDFGKHIKEINPDFVKVLVKYDSAKDNKNQLRKLYELSQFCEKNNYNLIFELLIPSKENRLEKTIKAIREIKNFVKVNIWKMEGYQKEEWLEIIKEMNDKERIIVLGRGENKEFVENWLKEASLIDKVIGFAVGRTIFLEALKEYYQNKISKEEAVNKIKSNLEYFVNIWRKEKLGD